MISIVTWLWREGFRDYCAEHVNALAHMWREKLSLPHRFICVADEGERFAPHVEHFVTPPEAARVGALRNPEGVRFPSCYRRLWMFSKAAQALGERVMLIDLDLVLTADPAPLFNYHADFVGWRPRMRWGNQQRVGGGIYLLRTGARAHVWDEFRGAQSITLARGAGFRGSDQAWLSYYLGKGETYWPRDCGIYSIRDFSTDPKQTNGRRGLPADALLVQFNGPLKAWMPAAQRMPWVRMNWPRVESSEPVRC